MEIFQYQARENKVYRNFLQNLRVIPQQIKSPAEIPFLPIGFFKTHRVVAGNAEPEVCFTSSGTTGTSTSNHFVQDVNVYENSFRKAFSHFYGDVKDLCILALLPSYLEREGSSLVYMVNDLIQKSSHPESGFFLDDLDKLSIQLKEMESRGQKTLLIGVTYALLDLAEKEQLSLKHTIVMETGGMKGKRKEMIREELHEYLQQKFGVKSIHSEYGMTELLSQGYSKGNGVFDCPPWMKILIRDTNDPFSILQPGKTGGINVIDLANINSCSFIATQDLGRTSADETYEVLGRFDNSDLRGCNLLVG
ncbi:MAG: acyl transferase [Bacteroidota bacterium]|nr:acyl transferase [Bacteroidota bacterium]